MKELQINAVKRWHEAVNSGDMEQMDLLVAQDVQLIGPKGRSSGLQALTDWIAKSGVSLTLISLYYKTDCVIAEQEATWHSVIDDSQAVATVFKFNGLQICSIQRYIHTQQALLEEGIENGDAYDNNI